MKRLVTACIAALVAAAAPCQVDDPEPDIRDLAFLIGTWKVSAVHADVSDPGAPGRRETGTKVCRWALEVGGEPSFIACENRSTYEGSGEEAYLEYLVYNPYAASFEKTNLFSSFPVTVVERVHFDADARLVEIRGRVEVGHEVDTYVETWRFDETHASFEREALINRSSMPLTEFRRIVTGRAVRAEG